MQTISVVFYFILFLSSIFILCSPFDVTIFGNFDTNNKKVNIFIKIIVFRIKLKKSKKKKKRKKSLLGIKIKKLAVKKPIQIDLFYHSIRSKEIASLENKITKIDVEKLGSRLSNRFPSIDILLQNDNASHGINAVFSLRVKLNLFIIFSSVLQTITIRRNRQ